MALPVLAFFPWLVGVFASSLTALFTFFASFMALRYAARFAIVTAYVVAIAAITVTVALGVKAGIMQIQVSMPMSLGSATYFLPNNINIIMAAYFSMRISWYLFNWTKDRLTAYVRIVGAA